MRQFCNVAVWDIKVSASPQSPLMNYNNWSFKKINNTIVPILYARTREFVHIGKISTLFTFCFGQVLLYLVVFNKFTHILNYNLMSQSYHLSQKQKLPWLPSISRTSSSTWSNLNDVIVFQEHRLTSSSSWMNSPFSMIIVSISGGWCYGCSVAQPPI